jgi:4-amino-4-deoxy-L-arabinose transferase-like glycosyltransferase
VTDILSDKSQRAWVLLLVLLLGAYYLAIGGADLIASGEARAAEIAREMVQHQDYVLPTLNHQLSQHTLTKPPLYHWLLIANSRLFGWSNTAVRVPVILSAIITILLVFSLGRRMFGGNAGLYAAVVMASTLLFLTNANVARMDIVFSMLLLLSLWGFYSAFSDASRRYMIWWFYAAMGMAVMVKGPAGLIIPLGVSLLYSWSSGQFARWRELQVLPGLALFLLLTLPWYVLVAMRAPSDLVTFFFFGNLAEWWQGNAARPDGEAQVFWYYLPYVILGLFPWSLFLPGAIVTGVRERRNPDHRPVLLLLFWFLGGLLLFSLGGKKAARYILTVLPAGALLAGYYWEALRQKRGQHLGRGHHLGLMAGAGVMLLLALAIFVAMALGFAHPERALQVLTHGSNAGERASIQIVWAYLGQHRAVTLLILAVMFASAVIACVMLWRKRLQPGLLALALMVWLLFLPYAAFVEPLKDERISPRRIAEEVAAMLPRDAVLYSGGQQYQHSFRWYLGHDIQRELPNQARARVLAEPDSWIVMFSRQALPPELVNSRAGVRHWQVDYYHITLFPGKKPG